MTPHRKIGAAVLVGAVGIANVDWPQRTSLGIANRLFSSGMAAAGTSAGLRPASAAPASWAVWGFVFARLWGLVVLVPVAEELFWRGFLNRWIQSPHWEEVPVGRFTAGSFVTVTLLFALAHPEWLAAACYCALVNGLLIWKRDLWRLHRRPCDEQLDPRPLHSPDRILVAVVVGLHDIHRITVALRHTLRCTPGRPTQSVTERDRGSLSRCPGFSFPASDNGF